MLVLMYDGGRYVEGGILPILRQQISRIHHRKDRGWLRAAAVV